ncbi:hypothetical protein [Streptomyces spectabilis]|uniref:hypothetical protein n=1 Tax=Streptomyces spectabilis TaxID=68270 RepID=UPI001CEF5884|nr:hypothetical protein [Streptomyces spectabilis]
MSTTPKRTGTSTLHRRVGRTALAASALLAGALLAGCSDDGGSSSNEAKGSAAPDPSPTSPFDRALAFSTCMRENGVAKFPDPQQGGSGGLQLTPGQGVDPNSPEFQKAMDACRDKMPQGELGGGGGGGGGGKPLDSRKVAAWAKCMRENGLPNLPDPEINGGSMSIDFASSGINPGGDAFQKARVACQDKWPGGGLTGTGGGQ